jgi:hypothetical protein
MVIRTMKIIRSVGESFTKIGHDEARTLKRGIRQKPADEVLAADQVADFLMTDALLTVRQTIAVLDKVVGKARTLRNFHVKAYVDRAHISRHLWNGISARFHGLDDAQISDLRTRWDAKVHPYARKGVSPERPETDNNAKVIGGAENDRTRDQFEGRWHKTFWRTGADGQPDHKAIAAVILAHLHEQEHKGSSKQGDEKHRSKKSALTAAAATGMGLVAARAYSIVQGTNDPREGRKSRVAEIKPIWDIESEGIYFAPDDLGQDIAARIRAKCLASPPPNQKINSAYIGQLIYEHFGSLTGKTEANSDARMRLWYLNTAVRDFYRKLTTTIRFQKAVEEAAKRAEFGEPADGKKKPKKLRLELILPADSEALLRAMGARRRNAQFSELIRLGKLVAHASDTVETPTTTLLKERMDWFATSDGQSEIKRNEAFVRVWRSAVAQSFGTLRALVDPESDFADLSSNNEGEENDNPGKSGAVSRQAALHLRVDRFNQHIKLVFGAKQIDGQSRAGIFSFEAENQTRELAWALMRLASVVRNRVSHFIIKGRLLQLIKGGALNAVEDMPGLDTPHRGGGNAAPFVLQKFDLLLEFDEALDWQIVIDSLDGLKAGNYLDEDQVTQVIDELIATDSDPEISVPRFMAMMQRAKGLMLAAADTEVALPGIGGIELKDHEQTSELDRLKLGLLRLLYQRGFQAWLAEQDDGSGGLSNFISACFDAKRARSAAAAEKQKREYIDVDTLLTDFDLTRFTTLKDLFGELQRLGMQTNGDHLRYNPDRDRQSALSREIEQFRQELIADLFALYLDDKGLEWVCDLSEPNDAQEPIDLSTTNLPEGHRTGNPDRQCHEHEAQFYAWLYLLPVETVSHLRHQFRKTIALEKRAVAQQSTEVKAGVQPLDDAALAAENALVVNMDRLMALYVRVQGAGFAGNEHEGSANKLAGLLYEDAAQFDRLFSEAAENHDESIAGTRSGLREILRFGHLSALEPVFKHHKVTTKEVTEQVERVPETAQWFADKRKLHDEIFAIANTRDRDEAALTAKCSEYAQLATKCTLHNFSVKAARLNDHIRAHHMMVAVVSRLVDFALMWERDRFYLLLGMLYRQWTDDGHSFEFCKRDGEFGIKRAIENGKDHFMPIWNEMDGFALHNELRFWSKVDFLCTDFKKQFVRQFGDPNPKFVTEQHAYDVQADRNAKPTRPAKQFNYRTGKKQIRNDLAHYNVLHPKRGRRINLTYLVNAVRSLFGHDRKMKNVIPRAIADVLAREGVTIAWQLVEDRLKRPLMLPVIETHLATIKAHAGREVPVLIPRVSVRYNSMVKGLFESDKGGYRMPIMADEKKVRRGEMTYPPALFTKVGAAMPRELVNQKLPKSGSD